MATSALISEINSLKVEIKRRSQALSKLRKRKKELESKLIQFLDNNNQRGVTYKGKLAIVKQQKSRSIRRLRKNEKALLAKEMLEKYGIQNTGKLAQDLVELMSGPREMITKLKYEKL